MESRGIFLYIWGKAEYGMMASQLAMSIKRHSPLIPIHLLTDRAAVSRLRHLNFFDTVQYTETPTDPAQAKIDMYEKLPFDHNIFLDADGLCVSEMDSTFDTLISSEKPFQCFVHAWYNKDSAPIMPLMVWANRDVIWDHYGFTDEKLPATQSSFLYIRKGDVCKEIYSRMQVNYQNKIPLENLRNRWGGGQADELYLNVTLSQMGYDPTCSNIIYFADDKTLHPHQIKHQYKILSLFGTAQNVKPIFERFYDREVETISGQMNGGVVYKWKNIKNSKHANTQQIVNRRSAFKGKFIRSEKLNPREPIVKHGKTMLFTSYFDSGSEQRQRELIHVLKNNLDHTSIDLVTVLSDIPVPLVHEKLSVIKHDRPTFQNMVDYANLIAGATDVVVIANSDIYFDNTIDWPHSLPMQKTCIALSRWDVYPNGTKRLFAFEHSQDTWIFTGKISVTDCEYFMGVLGCDNRFANDLNKAGYRVLNTAKDIITYHWHNSNIHSLSHKTRLSGDYLPVFITSIRDIKANKLLIKQPGKVGDIIICAPIAKYFADQGYIVQWECPKEYHHLFSYFDYVTPVESETEEYSRVIDISFGLNLKSPSNLTWKKRKAELDSFVTLKYELADVPVSELRNLVYTRNLQNETLLYDKVVEEYGSDYILVHDESDYGTPITVDSPHSVVYFEKIDGMSIFDWRKVIENAIEVHCIDSSLCNFTDAIPLQKPRLVYYKTDRVPQKADETILVSNWERINELKTIPACL